jgi:hypothetical protein
MKKDVRSSMQDVTARRRAMIERGFLPIPLYANKNPALKGWPEVVADEDMIRDRWWQKWADTGIITKTTPVIDVDITDEGATKAIEALSDSASVTPAKYCVGSAGRRNLRCHSKPTNRSRRSSYWYGRRGPRSRRKKTTARELKYSAMASKS